MVLAAMLCGCPVPHRWHLGWLLGVGTLPLEAERSEECSKGWLCVPVSLQLCLLSGQNVVAAFSILGSRVHIYPFFLSTHFQANSVTSYPPSPLCPVPVPPQPEEWSTQELLCCRALVAPVAPLH